MSHGTPKLEAKHYQLGSDSLWRKMHVAFPVGLVVIVLSMVLGATGGSESAAHFVHAYLAAYAFGLSIALGAMFFVLVNLLTRAGWSVGIRRVAENLMISTPVFALLFIPFMIPLADGKTGVEILFAMWVDPAPGDFLVEAKEPYLNLPFFYVRTVICFAAWTAIAVFFFKKSREQDETGDKEITRKLQMYAAPALMVYALTVTMWAVDWLMSLNPHWFSTIWGVYYFAGSMVAIFATLSLLSLQMKKREGLLGPAVTVEHRHDLGKFLFAFVVFWSYIGFSQYMLIWYAQLPEETLWYAYRLYDLNEVAAIDPVTGVEYMKEVREPNGWYPVSIFLMIGHFAVPFFFLMSRHIKRRTVTLVIGSVWMLVVHYVDMWWVVMPSYYHHGPNTGATMLAIDGLTLLGSVMVLLGVFALATRRGNVVAINDPRLPEALRFQNF